MIPESLHTLHQNVLCVGQSCACYLMLITLLYRRELQMRVAVRGGAGSCSDGNLRCVLALDLSFAVIILVCSFSQTDCLHVRVCGQRVHRLAVSIYRSSGGGRAQVALGAVDSEAHR